MSDFALEESHPIFPVFLVVDVSGSMDGTPIDAINDNLPQLKHVVSTDPVVGEIARLGLITFSDSAQLVLPLSDLGYVDIPRLAIGGLTNFEDAFRRTRGELESGISGLGKGTRFHKPVVFFISDGGHNVGGDWRAALRDLTDSGWKFHPEVVVFGYGAAQQGELTEIATRFCFMAKDNDPVSAVREIINVIVGSIRTTSRSLSGADGGLIVGPDPNKFTQLPVHTV
jgi:uncharacterized protein YegL